MKGKRIKWIVRPLLILALLAALAVPFAAPAMAADPVVTITFSAKVVAGTNTQASWAIGQVIANDVKYFSADNNEDDNYSEFENTGNVAVDVELQGTDAEGGDYDITLAAAAGSEQMSIYANSSNGTSTYDIEIKTSSYTDLTTNLGPGATYVWSMKATFPTAFNVDDDGGEKSMSVTLAVTEHT